MKKYILKSIVTILIMLPMMAITVACVSCSDSGTGETWVFEDDKEKPVDKVEKPRFIWVDAAANFPDFANSKENIKRDLTKAKEAGFTDIVVDVRPTVGDALFKTNVVDQVQSLSAWVGGKQVEIKRTETWDYLQAFIEIGHSLDLKIYAAMNTFVGGSDTNVRGKVGLLYRDVTKKDWATSVLTTTGQIENVLDQTDEKGTKFFNPVNEDVQEFLCQLVEDLAAYENLDGIFLDRGRFENLSSDFSNYTRNKFENFLGQKVDVFPHEVMLPGTKAGSLPADQPKHFKKWLEFRAKTIHDFMNKAQKRAKAKNPKINFGVYVGAWYASYYDVGVNWASKKFDTAKTYPSWASKDYAKYGYADAMDIMLLGAYADPKRITGTADWTVEGFCLNAMKRIQGDALVVGGPDVGNGNWATDPIESVNVAIQNSVGPAIHACDGYFLFDMIHLKKKDQWQYVQAGIDDYLKTLSK